LTERTIKGWLTEEYDYEQPQRGQVLEGIILDVDGRGVMVDVGLKRDGFVPESDLERLGEEDVARLEPGQEIEARILRTEDRAGRILLSMYQARLREDWSKALKMLESGKVWRGEVIEFNKGGLIVEFGRIRGFVPGSHLGARGRRRSSPDKRRELFQEYVGEELPLKVIEVNRDERRLIMSERLARRQMRRRERERLLDELVEGQVVEGTVRRLMDFGAFVDIGGADGLIHISELAWQYVEHPSEMLEPGQKVKVYVLELDYERKRIALSLKRLQPYPWAVVETDYSEGQLISGTVTGIADFGAFVALDSGVEGLAHISELSDPPPEHPTAVVQSGDELVLRILNIDAYRQRIGLSLKDVSDEERERWLNEQAEDRTEEPDEAQPSPAVTTLSTDNGKSSTEMVHETPET
jgi:small subunit ribosomal protein S1